MKPNDNGGLDYKDKESNEKAKNVDLISFPKNIQGTNCFNCEYIEKIDEDIGFCTNNIVKLFVTKQMCCNAWTEKGTTRSWEIK